MIDPTNTEPIPVHTPHVRRVLSALAVILLVVTAVVLVLRDVDFNIPDSDVPVVPPPSETGKSILPGNVESEFNAITERVSRGEISQGEGERLMTELFKQAVPPPPAN